MKRDEGDDEAEKYNRFHNPEVEFKRLIEQNKVINRGMKHGKKKLSEVQGTKLDESFEMFNRAFHFPRKEFIPPNWSPRSDRNTPKSPSDIETTTKCKYHPILNF